jgi:[acyl-carrier-protein] S-malonyltransferase
MGRALADAFPEARETFAEANDALGQALSRIIFEGPEDELTRTENAQPAILTVSVAACRVLVKRGISPVYLAGHSLGEYSAHVAAGTFSFGDAVRTVRERGRYMQEAVPIGQGAMAAILGLDARAVAQACEEAADGDVVSPANLNGPGQVVIAGSRAAVERAGKRARALGAKRVVFLAVSAPFHCPLMKPAEDRLAPDLLALTVHDPRVPVVANVDAEPKREGGAAIEALIRQVSAPVKWEASVRRLASAGVTTYVEVGPGSVLTALIRKIDRMATAVSFGSPADIGAIEPLLQS